MHRARRRSSRGAGVVVGSNRSASPLLQPQHPSICCVIRTGIREVIERAFGRANEMTLNERCAFGRTLFWMLDATFPFEHRPTVVAVLGELRKNAFEVDLAVAERTKSA